MDKYRKVELLSSEICFHQLTGQLENRVTCQILTQQRFLKRTKVYRNIPSTGLNRTVSSDLLLCVVLRIYDLVMILSGHQLAKPRDSYEWSRGMPHLPTI
jgi:hypothetical protein